MRRLLILVTLAIVAFFLAEGVGSLASAVLVVRGPRLGAGRSPPTLARMPRDVDAIELANLVAPPEIPTPPPPAERTADCRELTLVGVVVDEAGRPARAALRDATQGPVVVGVGDEVHGRSVSQIARRHVVLSSSDAACSLSLGSRRTPTPASDHQASWK